MKIISTSIRLLVLKKKKKLLLFISVNIWNHVITYINIYRGFFIINMNVTF